MGSKDPAEAEQPEHETKPLKKDQKEEDPMSRRPGRLQKMRRSGKK